MEKKLCYLKAKVRNMCYYRLSIEPKLKRESRCQYTHILREIRREALELKGLDLEIDKLPFLIPANVNTDTALEVIKNINNEFKG